MSCAHGEPLNTRILGHVWTRIPGDSCDLPTAALVNELSCRRKGRIDGEPAPAPDDLAMPGGTPRDRFSQIVSRPSEEFYNEYDTSGEAEANTEPISFSYGEHVDTCAGIDYAAFVERAENRARFHHGLLSARTAAPKAPFTILRRDWWTVPDTLVVVVVYSQV
jgi:hypothetical protein